jgi:amino-acid N-acetyltransferase
MAELNLEVRAAEIEDLTSILKLLQNAALPCQEIEEFINTTIVLEMNGAVIGCVALELYGNYALLRSLAVDEMHRSNGYGKLLVGKILKLAKCHKVKRLYLLTETAAKFFPSFKFKEISRDKIPNIVKSSREFTTFCPASAVAMTLEIEYN